MKKILKVIVYSFFLVLISGFVFRIIYIENENINKRKEPNPFVLGTYYKKDPYDNEDISFLNKFRAQIIDKIYVSHNRVLTSRSIQNLNYHRNNITKKQEKLFPQGWDLSSKIIAYSLALETTKIKYETIVNQYSKLQKSWILYPEKIQQIDQIFKIPPLSRSKQYAIALKSYHKNQAELIISKEIPKLKKELAMLKNRIKTINDLLFIKYEEYLYLQGMYEFYDQQIALIDLRITDYLIDGDNVANWYIENINNQNQAYQFAWPIIPSLGISAGFRCPAYKKRFGFEHFGFDIETRDSEKVYTIASGEVVATSSNCIFSYVKIKHDYEFESLYGHTVKHNVKVGDIVKRGDFIAYSDGYPGNCGSAQSTGRHLHMELFLNEERIDPLYYFDISFVPIERIPNFFDFEKYYAHIAYKDFNNNGIENVFELAMKKNIYAKDHYKNEEYLIKTNAIELNMKDFLSMK